MAADIANRQIQFSKSLQETFTTKSGKNQGAREVQDIGHRWGAGGRVRERGILPCWREVFREVLAVEIQVCGIGDVWGCVLLTWAVGWPAVPGHGPLQHVKATIAGTVNVLGMLAPHRSREKEVTRRQNRAPCGPNFGIRADLSGGR